MLAVLGLVAALCILAAARSMSTMRDAAARHALIERVNELLPQTQCGRCHFDGCRPYAEALIAGRAAINQCPPGGEKTILALADLLGEDARPLDPAFGTEQRPQVAFIDEDLCIGCAKCLPACPVDAIVGAPKKMHTVIAEECTGCALCIPPCPVDCIVLVSAREPETLPQLSMASMPAVQ